MKNKVIIALIILCIIVSVVPSYTVKAGVTDNNTGNIIRKTTTNYYTTIEFKGKVTDEKTGKVENFEKKSEELIGNYDSELVLTNIESLKTEFRNWATEKKASIINYSDGEVTDYYYDAHDEITQSKDGNSDVILIGDINDLDNAYTTQGTITINTILDKHQTFTINAEVIIKNDDVDPSKVVKNINVELTAPTIGDSVTLRNVHNDEYNYDYQEPDNVPTVTVSDNGNYEVTHTEWITGTYVEIGDEFESPFSGVFEKDKYYYAMVYVSAKEGYFLSEDKLQIKVNGEKPAEVFTVYGKTNTMFIAKIKAKENSFVYNLNDEYGNKISFKEQKGKILAFSMMDILSLTEDQVVELGGTKELFDEIVTGTTNSTKEYGTLLKLYDIVVSDASVDIHQVDGGFVIKIKITNDMKEYDNFKLIYVNDDYTIEKPVTLTKEGDYLVGTLKHLSGYALVGNKAEITAEDNKLVSNPETGDNIAIIVAVFVFATLGLYITSKISKKTNQ